MYSFVGRVSARHVIPWDRCTATHSRTLPGFQGSLQVDQFLTSFESVSAIGPFMNMSINLRSLLQIPVPGPIAVMLPCLVPKLKYWTC